MNQIESKSAQKILVLEPYYGGSHKSFLEGLKQLPFEFHFLTLPARKWKWRMRLAAPYYAEQLKKIDNSFDRVFCSTFVDVAALRGMGPPWVRMKPLLTYFHENQFVYPTQVEDERDHHFALTNMTTALASDGLAFNSQYNHDTFLDGIEKLLKESYDLKLHDPYESIRSKSRILAPGIDFSVIDSTAAERKDGPPVILWNHRWEHDKNPDEFFNTLFELDQNDIEFRLVVLGKSYKDVPTIFEKAKKILSHKCLRFGYAASREAYAQWLKRSDIVVSTARHEFFGIAVMEAVRAGCRPLVPKRLSYPELFPDKFLYDENDFPQKLIEVIRDNQKLKREESYELTKNFSWKHLQPEYISWIDGVQQIDDSGLPT